MKSGHGSSGFRLNCRGYAYVIMEVMLADTDDFIVQGLL